MVSPPISASLTRPVEASEGSAGAPCATQEATASLVEFAELRGVNRSQVTRWLSYTPPIPHLVINGRKRILIEAGEAWCVGVLQARATAGKAEVLKSKPESIEQKLAMLKLKEAELSFAMRQSKHEEQMGRLVARDAVRRSFEKSLALVRQKMMETPLRFAAELASESGGEQVAIRVTLDRLMRQTLKELSDGMAQIGL
jgi:hypothetical protein